MKWAEKLLRFKSKNSMFWQASLCYKKLCEIVNIPLILLLHHLLSGTCNQFRNPFIYCRDEISTIRTICQIVWENHQQGMYKNEAVPQSDYSRLMCRVFICTILYWDDLYFFQSTRLQQAWIVLRDFQLKSQSQN